MSYFEVQDSSQFRYKIGYVSTELDPHLVSGGLAAGEAARGWVTFEIQRMPSWSPSGQPEPLGHDGERGSPSLNEVNGSSGHAY